jgi:hypothetical protein
MKCYMRKCNQKMLGFRFLKVDKTSVCYSLTQLMRKVLNSLILSNQNQHDTITYDYNTHN